MRMKYVAMAFLLYGLVQPFFGAHTKSYYLRDIDHQRATDRKEKLVGSAGDERRQRRRLSRGLDLQREQSAPEDNSNRQSRREMRCQSSPGFLCNPIERQPEAAVLDCLHGSD